MPRAVIVGAGIGGLTTAIGLHRAGWSVTVLERWPQIVGIGAALGMWPSAQQGLGRVGLDDEFRRNSVPAAGGALYARDGRKLVGFPDGSARMPKVRLISRRRLMELLVERASGIDIQTAVRADPDTLRAALADGDVLVGADGLRSTVRRTFLPSAAEPRYSGLVGWRGQVDFESGGYGETWGDGALFGNTPVEPGRTNFYAAVPVPAGELPRYDDPDGEITAPGVGFAELAERYRGWRDPIGRILAEANPDDVLRHPIYDLGPALPTFVGGKVAVLGDAAHAMTPHLGRGACEAILDAVALVDQLTSQHDVAAALAGYNTQRRRPAQRIAARSRQMMRLAHAQGAAAVVRNGLVGTVGRFLR